MAECSIQDKIRNGIQDKANNMLTESGQFERVDRDSVRVIQPESDFGKTVMDVNTAFGEQLVVKNEEEYKINPSDNLVQEYLNVAPQEEQKDELIDNYINKELHIRPTYISEFNQLSEELQKDLEQYLEFNSPAEGLFESIGGFIIQYDNGFNLYKNLPYRYQSLNEVELRKYQIASDMSLSDIRTFIGLTYEPLANKQGLSKRVRDKYFPDGDFTESGRVLSIIAQNNSWLSPVAKRLLEYNTSIPIVAEDRGPYKNGENNIKIESAAAFYSPSLNQIGIATQAESDGRLEETLVHEILHGLTVNFIRQNPQDNLVKDLDRVLEYLKSKAPDKYYLSSKEEMIVGFFTNPEFITKLKNTPTKGLVTGYKNIWEQVLDYIARAFNFSTRDMNLYNELYGLMTNVVDEGYNYSQKREMFYDYQEGFDEYDMTSVGNEFIQPIKYNIGNEQKVFPAFRDNLPINIKRGLEGKFTSTEVAQMSLTKLGQRLQKLFPQTKIEYISPQNLRQEDHIEDVKNIKGYIKGNTIFLVEGRIDEETTVEEFLHPVVLGLSTVNEELFNNLVDEALKTYSSEYNTLKEKRGEEEAKLEIVTKALRDKVIKNSNPSLYQQFIDFLKSVYKRLFFKSNPDIKTDSTLEDIAKLLLKGGHDFKTQYTDTIFYNTEGQEWVDKTRDKIINHPKNNGIAEVEGGYTMFGRKITRVSTLVKQVVDEFFKGKPVNEKIKAEGEVAAEEGTEGHAAVQHIINREIDPITGKFRETPLPYEPYQGLSLKAFEQIDEAITNILELYRGIDGVVILTEQVVANVKKKSAIGGKSDFIAILPTKEIHILDWKFIINRKDKKSHPNWKKAGWNKQLTEYKAAIQQAISATDEEMNKYTTKARMVPFMTNYTSDGVTVNNEDVRGSKIYSVEIPSLVQKINVPRTKYMYVTEAEIGTKKKLTELVNKIKQISATELKLKQNETQRKATIDYVFDENINNAIQDFFLFGNMEEILSIHEKTLEDIEAYLSSLNQKEVSELIEDINFQKTQEYVKALSDLSKSITGLYPVAEIVFGKGLENSILSEQEKANPENIEKENKLKERIKTIQINSQKYIDEIIEKNEEINNAVAKSEGIAELLKPEMEVRGWWKRNLTSNKSGQTRAVILLTKFLEKITPKLLLKINEEKLKIKKLQDNVEKHGSRKTKELLDFMVNKNTGKLNSKYTSEFWDQYNTIKESGNKKIMEAFVRKWYNLDKAKEIFNNEMEIKLNEIESTLQYQSEEAKERAAKNIRDYWDLDGESEAPWRRVITQLDNYLIEDDKFLKEYASDFYTQLKADKYASDFYNYIISTNKRIQSLGFISNPYTFIPFVPKGFTEAKLKDYYNVMKMKVQVRSGEEYGEVDAITGERKKGFGMPFVDDIFGKDKSKMSFDLFYNYSVLIEQLESVEAKQKLEAFSNNLLEIEKNKKVIPVGVTGNPLRKAGTNSNLEDISSAKNAEYLEEYIDSLIYGIKIKESADWRFSIDKMKEIQDPNDPNKTIQVIDRVEHYSGAKMLQEALNLIYLNTFGLNIFTPARQYISSIGQSYFASNGYYSGEDIARNERFFSKLLKGMKSSNKRDLLFEYTMPFLNPEFEQQANSVSAFGVKRWMSMENMMYLMRLSSGATQAIVANSILDNITVVDGKAYMIKDYINDKYSDLYEKNGDVYKYSAEERKTLQKQIDQEIKELKKNKLDDYIQVNGENIEIVGVENKDEILNRLRSLSQYYSKQITGEGSRDEIMLGQRNALSRLFMMYRSWIPRTVKARAGTFEFNTELNNYEWGRWGAYSSVVSKAYKDGLFKSAKYALGIGMKEDLIEYAKEKYFQLEEKLRRENKLITGEMMSEKEFIDLYLNNYSKSHREFKFILGMMSLLSTPFMVGGEGDDDRTKAIKAFVRFHFDRMQDEFSFYVNPKSFIDILGNSVPATSYAKKLMTAAMNPVQEIWYGLSGDERAAENNQVIRDFFNLLPVTSQMTKIIPIISPDIAKEFGLRPVQIIN